MGYYSTTIQGTLREFLKALAVIGCCMAMAGCDTPAATNAGQEQTSSAAGESRIITTESGLKIKVTVLPGLDNTDFTLPYSINGHGQIVGYSRPPEGGEFRAVLWDNGKIRALDRDISAVSINCNGVIIGEIGGHPYFMKNGEITDFNNQIELYGRIFDLNNKGQILGWAGSTTFIYDHGNVSYYEEIRGYAINEKGHFAGRLNKYDDSIEDGFPDGPPETDRVPFLWKDGEVIELGLLDGGDGNGFPDEGFATSVNDYDQVVGYSTFNKYGERAFLWEDGVLTNLGILRDDPLASHSRSRATDINNEGQIVGQSDTFVEGYASRHAFLWEDGKMIDLGAKELLGLDFDTSSEAVAINNKGQIAGWFVDYPSGDYSSRRIRAVLWEIME